MDAKDQTKAAAGLADSERDPLFTFGRNHCELIAHRYPSLPANVCTDGNVFKGGYW